MDGMILKNGQFVADVRVTLVSTVRNSERPGLGGRFETAEGEYVEPGNYTLKLADGRSARILVDPPGEFLFDGRPLQ